MSDTALVHLYRGELGRMTLYRVRLDTTTNWAIGMNAAVISLGLTAGLPHLLYTAAALLNVVFLLMEARRFRSYELIRHRVRIMETGFYVDRLTNRTSEGWREALAQSLEHPKLPISLLEAVSLRLRRNYLALFVVEYAAWGFRFTQESPKDLRYVVAGGLVLLLVLGVLAALHRPAEEG